MPEVDAVRDLTVEVAADELNRLSSGYQIGSLQDIRQELKNFYRRPGSKIFAWPTIKNEYACHFGGRTELQFNIGYDYWNNKTTNFRHGVAFSFSRSQTLKTLEPLYPKVRRFNEFLSLYPDRFRHMKMWHCHVNPSFRSEDYSPGPIPKDLVQEGNFIFLGKYQPLGELHYHNILSDFDELLPLYKFTESGKASDPVITTADGRFDFRPGCSLRPEWTTATIRQKQIDVDLRHNRMQTLLHDLLCKTHGENNVRTEQATGTGMYIDLAVRLSDEDYIFYEIKTDSSPRSCLRQAIGQLLEYSFWPKSKCPIKLVVVGSSTLDEDSKSYLGRLNKRFPLPLDYQCVELDDHADDMLSQKFSQPLSQVEP